MIVIEANTLPASTPSTVIYIRKQLLKILLYLHEDSWRRSLPQGLKLEYTILDEGFSLLNKSPS